MEEKKEHILDESSRKMLVIAAVLRIFWIVVTLAIIITIVLIFVFGSEDNSLYRWLMDLWLQIKGWFRL